MVVLSVRPLVSGFLLSILLFAWFSSIRPCWSVTMYFFAILEGLK